MFEEDDNYYEDLKKRIEKEVKVGAGPYFNLMQQIYGNNIPKSSAFSSDEVMDFDDIVKKLERYRNRPKIVSSQDEFEQKMAKQKNKYQPIDSYDQEQLMKLQDTINKIHEMYRQNSILGKQNKESVRIGPDDFSRLSKFEKNTLRTIANIWGLISDTSKDISYSDLVNVMNKLSENKNDIEKHYLLSLLFPEKVKNIHTIYPFPVPTYTYVQKFQVFVSPNANGCFLAQVVCPLLLDNSVANAAVSNLYVNNAPGLNGTNLGNVADFTPITSTQTIPGAFTTYVLQCCKLSARYVGRPDVISGYFGAGYCIASVNSKVPDVNPTQFNYVDESINSVIGDVTEGMNVVYYPPDYSYLNFLKINNDNVAGGKTKILIYFRTNVNKSQNEYLWFLFTTPRASWSVCRDNFIVYLCMECNPNTSFCGFTTFGL
jgi:hypothetical protein